MDAEKPEQEGSVLSRVARRQQQRQAQAPKPQKHYRFNRRRTMRLAGWGLLFVGLFVLGRIPFFYLRSWWVGHTLVQTALKASPTNNHHGHGQSVAPWPSSVLSVLEIPSLGVNAPVIQGTQMQQLNVAVGHLPSSVYPGQSGTSILAGHNATWFRHINRLKSGNVITVVDRHRVLTYHVTRSAVLGVGAPVYNTSNSSIVLEACYPLNVLYLTPYRYLVWATLVSIRSTKTGKPTIPPNTQYTPVGIPPAVQAQGLTLATNYLPMGTLTIQGHPSKSWRQSNAPLNAADATTTLFFAMLHIAQANNSTWWHELAPNLPYSTIQPLIGSQITHFLSQADEFETVTGNKISGSALQIEVQLTGGTNPGDYKIAMQSLIKAGKVHLIKLYFQRVS